MQILILFQKREENIWTPDIISQNCNIVEIIKGEKEMSTIADTFIWKIIHSSHKITKESYWSFNTTKTLSVKSNLQNYKFWIGSAIQVLTSNLTLVMYPIRSV